MQIKLMNTLYALPASDIVSDDGLANLDFEGKAPIDLIELSSTSGNQKMIHGLIKFRFKLDTVLNIRRSTASTLSATRPADEYVKLTILNNAEALHLQGKNGEGT